MRPRMSLYPSTTSQAVCALCCGPEKDKGLTVACCLRKKVQCLSYKFLVCEFCLGHLPPLCDPEQIPVSLSLLSHLRSFAIGTHKHGRASLQRRAHGFQSLVSFSFPMISRPGGTNEKSLQFQAEGLCLMQTHAQIFKKITILYLDVLAKSEGRREGPVPCGFKLCDFGK